MIHVPPDTPLPVLIAATKQAWCHLREVHGIHRSGSATWSTVHHERAHRRERTPAHDAWTLEIDPAHHHHAPTDGEQS